MQLLLLLQLGHRCLLLLLLLFGCLLLLLLLHEALSMLLLLIVVVVDGGGGSMGLYGSCCCWLAFLILQFNTPGCGTTALFLLFIAAIAAPFMSVAVVPVTAPTAVLLCCYGPRMLFRLKCPAVVLLQLWTI